MSELTQKLDRFTAAIVAGATAETERTLEELKQKHDAAYSAAEKEIRLEVYRYICGEAAQIRRESGQRVSRHMLENKRTLYLRRGALAAEVFGQVQERIQAFTRTPAYRARLLELCRQSVGKLAGARDIKILLRPEDMGYASGLAAELPGVEAEFIPGEFQLGGLMAESDELGVFLDATFDSAMEDLNGHFAELFGLSLSDKLGDDLPAAERTAEP